MLINLTLLQSFHIYTELFVFARWKYFSICQPFYFKMSFSCTGAKHFTPTAKMGCGWYGTHPSRSKHTLKEHIGCHSTSWYFKATSHDGPWTNWPLEGQEAWWNPILRYVYNTTWNIYLSPSYTNRIGQDIPFWLI